MTTTVDRVLLVPAAAPNASPPAADAARWLSRYTRLLLLTDLTALTLAGIIAVLVRFGDSPDLVRGVSYYGVAAVIVACWLCALAAGRCYEQRFVGAGSEEFRRVGNASFRVAAVVALVGYGAQLELARGFVAVALPAGFVLLLAGRWLGRLWLHGARRRGRCSHRVVLVGAAADVRELARQFAREPASGLLVVGACVQDDFAGSVLGGGVDVPVVGSVLDVTSALVAVHADTVAVAASPGMTGEVLRELTYQLEGTGVDLLVAPALTNITGTRISIRPVAGLPLLHVDEPELTGGRKLLKAVFDRSVASLLLIIAAPVLCAIALGIRATSPGPALFRQQRVGRDGALFSVWKFRSMYVGAEQRRAELERLNELDGVLFKVRDDPRVTSVGRWLRKTSLDELPQLVNVLRGDMSLVGPRPPLPSEVEKYDGHAHRRLLVKPGMTGLWQVSGRSDLSWSETVRLDLQYVENWSLGLDLVVLTKTALTVARGKGAY